MIYFAFVLFLFCFFGGSALFGVTEDKFQGHGLKLAGRREKRIFYQTLGLCQYYIMKVDYCFLQGTTNCCDNVFIFSLFSTSVL